MHQKVVQVALWRGRDWGKWDENEDKGSSLNTKKKYNDLITHLWPFSCLPSWIVWPQIISSKDLWTFFILVVSDSSKDSEDI